MMIDLDDVEIEMLVNCVTFTMDKFSPDPMFIEYQMLIDSLKFQQARYHEPSSFGDFMAWARPPTRMDDR